MVTKRAVAMVTRVAGKDEGDGKGGKMVATKRAIASKRVMASNNNNKTTATEATMMTTTTCCAHGDNFYGYGGQVLKKSI